MIYLVPFVLLIAIGLYAIYFFSSREKRKQALAKDVSIDPALLEKHVLFYAALSPEAKRRFESGVHNFLEHTVITGIDTEVEALDRHLVASAAIIPIFGFKGWAYQNLEEVLLYSDAINTGFETTGTADRNILGMVGTGSFDNKMLLSKPALRLGFSNTSDHSNTAIHEFVHLLDKSDGDTDGIPRLLIDKQYVIPWLNLMYEIMQKAGKGGSDINAYAYTNKAEFFAVVSEYFFESPGLLSEKHPGLYAMLKKIFEVPAKP